MADQLQQALSVLGISLPEIRASSLSEAEAQVSAWKQDVLKPAWRALASRTHPDHGGNRGEFQAAQEAYRYLDQEIVAMPLEQHARTLDWRNVQQGISTLLGVLTIISQIGDVLGGPGPTPTPPVPVPPPDPTVPDPQ